MKDFDNWNTKKRATHEREEARLYHVREVWWCALGVNIGSEQDGTGTEYRRPVIILRGFGPATCLVVPLTTSPQIHKFRIPVGDVEGKSATGLMSQMRTIDTKRLVRKIGYVEKDTFEIIRKAARDML